MLPDGGRTSQIQATKWLRILPALNDDSARNRNVSLSFLGKAWRDRQREMEGQRLTNEQQREGDCAQS